MNTFHKLYIIISFILLSCFVFTNNATENIHYKSGITGIWQGNLNFNSSSLRIVFRITENETGALKAELDSPDQGANGIHVDTVIFNVDKIRMDVNSISGYYEGKYDENGSSIVGTWHQSGLEFPLALKKVDKIDEVKRPQEPKPPYPYKVEDVIYENNSAGIKLGGTLTMPETGGPFAAVILITGSGQQNRDEELLGHKPFLILADYLTRKGIAVLRVDDRGIGESTGNFAASTTKDFVTDVLAGVEYLKTRKEINHNKIGLIGHSEGGMIAPMAASQSKDVAFIVLMAGPGIPSDQLLHLQSAAIAKAEGASDDIIKSSEEMNKQMYNAIKTGTDSISITEKLKEIFNNKYNSLSESERSAMHMNKDTFERDLNQIMSPWFRYFISYDPAPALEKVACPVLAIDGSKDLQVLPDENLAGIKKALNKGGNKNYEIKKLPGLNHLFQTADTGSPIEYAKIEETISPSALNTIGDWILKITAK